MNSWNTHKVNFDSAEGLSTNETSIRVLDKDTNDYQERMFRMEQRIDELTDQQKSRSQVLHTRDVMTGQIKEDPGYKFLMMVSAFAKLRMGNMIKLNGVRNVSDHVHEEPCHVPSQASDINKWLNIPEITGVVQLTASVYGHIKEAEMIINNHCSIALKSLIENPLYATQFARLVSIRILLSGVLTGMGNRRDKSFVRLHQEQHMIVKALKRVEIGEGVDWTRPRR